MQHFKYFFHFIKNTIDLFIAICYNLQMKKLTLSFTKDKIVLIIALFLILNAFFSFAPAVYAKQSNENLPVYTVSWFTLPGLQELDQKGEPTGYVYEYLKKLQEYGEFDYRFVSEEIEGDYGEDTEIEGILHLAGTPICDSDGVLSYTECYQLARFGYIDILTSTLKTPEREEQLLFTNNGYGNVYYSLFTNLESDIKSGSYPEVLKVAMLGSDANKKDFEDYAKNKDINYEIFFKDDLSEVFSSLKNGSVDAAVNTGYISPEEYKVLDRFTPKLIYFATAKDKTELIAKLNLAVDALIIKEPLFTVTLYNKYFKWGGISLSQTEIITGFSVIAIITLVIILIAVVKTGHDKNKIIYYDRLTGAFTQLGFEAEARRKLNKQSNANYFVIDFDVDNFEIFNNINGYEAGDKLLMDLARMSLTFKGEPAIVARYEADHFAKLVCASSLKEVEETIHAQNAALTTLCPDYPITISYGIYEVRDKALAVSVMRDRACVAKRSIKENRNQIMGVYSEQMHQSKIEENQLLRSLEEALANQSFVPFYQPKIDTKTEKPVGLEALARLVKENGEILPPAAFIEALEKNGLITKLDFLIYTQVCDMLKEEISKGKEPLPVSVNFSRAHIYDVKFVNKLIKIAAERCIPCDLIEIELTESIFIEDREAVFKVVNNLHYAGFVVSIDDFGSGFSSLTVLKDVYFDILKLDRQFLSSSSSNERCLAIVESSIILAKQLGLITVAEGVETKEQLEFLRAAGCDRLQGYFFAKPMPYDKVKIYLEQVINAPRKSMSFKEIISTETLPLLDHTKGIEIKDKQRFQAMFDSMPLGLSVWGFSDNRLYEINKATLDILGRTKEEIEFTPWDALAHEDDKKHLEELYRSLLVDEKEKTSARIRFYRSDGKLAYVYMTLMAFGYNEKGENLALCILQDETSWVRQEERVRISEERYRIIENSIDEIVFDIDVERDIIVFLIKGQKPRKIHSYLQELEKNTHVHSDDIKKWKEALINCINSGCRSSGKLDCRSNIFGGGNYIWCRYLYSPICNSEGKVVQIVGRIENINEEMANLVKLRNEAQYDPLTKLYNRDNMAFQVESIMVRSPRHSSHVCFMIDLDNFRYSNAMHGHLMSDRILVKFARIINEIKDEKDLAARIGGDEFLVFAQNITKEKAREMAQKIITASLKFSVEGIGEVNQGCSIGAALYSGQNITYSQLVTQADSAMYYAKDHGKRQVIFYDEMSNAT